MGTEWKMKRRDAIEMLEDYLDGKNAFIMPGGDTQYADLDLRDYGARPLSKRVGNEKHKAGLVQFRVDELYHDYTGPDVNYINWIIDNL